MERIFSLSLLALVVVPFGCSSSETTVADAAHPVSKDEVFDACEGYCRRVAACDASIDETACVRTCDHVAEQARLESCEAPLYAALDCIDRHFCQYGFPDTTGAGSPASTPCDKKAAAVPCLIATPPELAPAFSFFGTGLGMSAFGTTGSAWNEDSNACTVGGVRSSDLDGTFDIPCAPDGDGFTCSCRIDGRVTATFETQHEVCPPDELLLDDLYARCGWRY